jgi:hypothetical protein
MKAYELAVRAAISAHHAARSAANSGDPGDCDLADVQEAARGRTDDNGDGGPDRLRAATRVRFSLFQQNAPPPSPPFPLLSCFSQHLFWYLPAQAKWKEFPILHPFVLHEIWQGLHILHPFLLHEIWQELHILHPFVLHEIWQESCNLSYCIKYGKTLK